MNKIKLGKPGIEISAMTIGCWPFGGGDYWGEQSQKDVDNVVHAVLEMNNKIQSCNYCEKGENLDSLMLKVIELPYSIVYLFKNQQHHGRCIVAYKDHKTEYFQLNAEEIAGLFTDVSRTAQALYNIFHPSKINYATFGDIVSHIHVHVVPKYEGGPDWGGYFSEEPKKFLSDSEYQDLINRIKTEIEKLR